jgi:4-diphosphocytidyl-2-C-methyl-D-erythritol kinase
MITFPNAKINLGLNIVSKRPDGYHNIETVFYPVRLYDALDIVPSIGGNTTFTQTGLTMDGDPHKNLVMKAFQVLKTAYDLPEIDIYLQKKIPFGAGLGGGSADAAFMLKLLNNFAGLGLSTEQLEAQAARIGADCPFFIQNRPVFAEGIGTLFTPITVSLEAYYLVIIKPDISVSTQEAYARVRPSQPQESIRDIVRCPVPDWKNRLVTDFEPSVFAQFPEIAVLKQQLYDQGALYASLSGSGSSVFGIFDRSEKPDLTIPHSLVVVI